MFRWPLLQQKVEIIWTFNDLCFNKVLTCILPQLYITWNISMTKKKNSKNTCAASLQAPHDNLVMTDAYDSFFFFFTFW